MNSGNKNEKESIKIKFQKIKEKIKGSKERQDFIKNSKKRIGAVREYINHKKSIAEDWATFLNKLNKPTIPNTDSPNFDLRINVRTEVSWLNLISWLDKNFKDHPKNIKIGKYMNGKTVTSYLKVGYKASIHPNLLEVPLPIAKLWSCPRRIDS